MPPPSDDNPYERPSPWPKMPQAPFRVGPLPKAAAPVRPPPPSFQPPQQTPNAAPRGVLTGSALPPPRARSAPPVSPSEPPAPQSAPPKAALVEPAPAPVAAEAPRIPDEPPLMLNPVLARTSGRKRAAASPGRLPLIAAGVVGAAGLAVLGVVLSSRSGPPAPAAVPVAAAPTAAVTTPPGEPAATPAPTLPVVETAAPARVAQVRPRVARSRAAPAASALEIPAPDIAPPPVVAANPTPVEVPPVVEVAPPPPPAPRPPADPNAPITTRPNPG